MSILRQWILLSVLLIVLSSASAQQEFRSETQTIDHNGNERTYLLHVPSTYDGETAVPVVFMLHGRGSTGEEMGFSTDMSRIAGEEGFIVVYPDGVDAEWNYFQSIGYENDETDDVGFIHALVEEIASTYNVDRERIYAAGLSNGGFMSYRLACEPDSPFAAYAAVAATAYSGLASLCDLTNPVPVLFMHGTADEIVPWDGASEDISSEETFYRSYSATDNFAFWATHNRCSTDVESTRIEPRGDSPGTSVMIIDAQDCATDSAVKFYTIINGGHTWPGTIWEGAPVDVVGLVNLDISADEEIWTFFSNYTLSDRPSADS